MLSKEENNAGNDKSSRSKLVSARRPTVLRAFPFRKAFLNKILDMKEKLTCKIVEGFYSDRLQTAFNYHTRVEEA